MRSKGGVMKSFSDLVRRLTGVLSRSLALVAIVIGDPMFMFGEGGAKGHATTA
jgi:type IV secretory pathway VirB2 component (pilin)